MNSEDIDWRKLNEDIDRNGFARLENLLAPEDCASLINEFGNEALYRRHIIMQQHGYGQGEYKYFTYPLPDPVARLREDFYPPLAQIANDWSERLSDGVQYPEKLADYTARCHAAGQLRPTPLILKYNAGDYNRLHQDLYGEHLFPLQMTILLSTPGADFDGGEFILTEQRARQQSRARVVPLKKGDAVVFAVNQRPIQGKTGSVRVTMRHGVSDVLAGQRYTLGIIFHDAK
ncbi:2OG-Fe(II) oxygenase [Sneathiella sp. CAU 1612]|uniref:2OG-Fe(II) oxygenase n=1 Tax=Sneathiella sedimenti TaxID=2816034 RepID=A0ABS3F6W5_9PROT|nr:2OG-Fe(II) oxygenase [Sneathiella sedimenti]MBO0334250.1 2OG-Fe(II) oxygenase [Sneathiella sedimenti]